MVPRSVIVAEVLVSERFAPPVHLLRNGQLYCTGKRIEPGRAGWAVRREAFPRATITCPNCVEGLI